MGVVRQLLQCEDCVALDMLQVEKGRHAPAACGQCVQDNEGRTALHLASYWWRIEVVRLLLMGGAHVDAQDKD